MTAAALRRPTPIPINQRLGLTYAQAVEYSSLSRRTLSEWARTGRLRVCRAGRRVVISPDDLRKAMFDYKPEGDDE